MDQVLPNTLSGLLRLAVDDAQKCEAQPDKFELDMSVWFAGVGAPGSEEDGSRPGEKPICTVCMAGAIIAQRGLADPMQPISREPGDFDDEIACKLAAINVMRMGAFAEAASDLGIKLSGVQADRLEQLDDIVIAARDRELLRAPWPVYLQVAEELEKIGL